MSDSYYNPYKKFVGSFIPNWLLCRKEVSQGAKLCFARLAQYAGRDGLAFPMMETLAKELGVSRQQISTYLNQLEKYKLVKRKRIGLGKSNTYYFLEHEWFTTECELKFTSDVNKSLHQNDNKSLHPIYEENHIRESDKNMGDANVKNIIDKKLTKKKKKAMKNRDKSISLTFEEIWTAYPTRGGTNSKIAALRCYLARIKEGVDHEVILLGVKNYFAHCKGDDIIDTKFVMQAQKFLGRDKHYETKFRKKKHWADEVNEELREEAVIVANKERQSV